MGGRRILLENNASERASAAAARFVRDNEVVSTDDVVTHLCETQEMAVLVKPPRLGVTRIRNAGLAAHALPTSHRHLLPG